MDSTDIGTAIEEGAMGISRTLREVLVSPNVLDSNGEHANLVDVLDDVARGLFAIAAAIRGDAPS